MDRQGTPWPRPTRPRLGVRRAYWLQRLLAANRFNRILGRFLAGSAPAYRWFTRVERVTKERIFGCLMCGQCALPVVGYACPMGCPKQLRNGPCGGVSPAGACEVHPDMPCVWVIAVERARAHGHADDLLLLHRPIDHRQWGESSWVNHWLGRDNDLWTGIGPGRPNLLTADPDLPGWPTLVPAARPGAGR